MIDAMPSSLDSGSDWLHAEYEQAAWDVGPRTVQLMKCLGVPPDVLYLQAKEYCTFGVARIETHKSGFYEPFDRGQIAIVQSCARCPEPYSPDVIDLVAWLPGNPGQWWVRIGCAPVLDLDEIDRAAFFGTALTVHGTPLDYLRAGCTGTVILRDAPFWLGGVQRIIAPDRETANRIAASFKTEIPQLRTVKELPNAA